MKSVLKGEMMKDSRKFIVMGLVIVLIGAAIFMLSRQAAAFDPTLAAVFDPTQAAASIPTQAAAYNPDQEMAESILEDLKNENMAPEDRKALEGKLEVIENNAARAQVNASEAETLRVKPQMPDPIAITVEVTTGIIPYPSVPYSTMDFLIENAWKERVGEAYVLVFAGTQTHDPQQGVLIIHDDAKKGKTEFVLTPEQHGTITIIAARGAQLELQAEDGTRLYFDVSARSFIENWDHAATVTPAKAQTLTPESTLPAYP